MQNGYAIVLSWPDTICKQAGAWYDPMMKLLGINKNGYYKVGHSAIVLVSERSGVCEYYDFGRYHSPEGYGRVRSKITDHDLTINTLAVCDDNGILLNQADILNELHGNPSCHGAGDIISSTIQVNIGRTRRAIYDVQQKGFLAYGPFVRNGTNCSRFVAHVLLRSGISLRKKISLLFQPTLSASPIGNVFSIRSGIEMLARRKCQYMEKVLVKIR